MWARHMEAALGLWLAVSPLVFHHSDRLELWLHDLLVASLIVTLSLVTHWQPLRRAHLLLLPLAVWLAAAGWWGTRGAGLHPLPAYQNWMIVGLTLAMFAIVPTRASLPPEERRARSAGERTREPT